MRIFSKKKAPEAKKPVYDQDRLVCDDLKDDLAPLGSIPVVGKAMCASPREFMMVLDFTGLRGTGANIYNSLIFQVPKWGYYNRKVDEFIEVTPTYMDYYNITIAQKNKIEASIKQGLTSASQAVADYELLKHDLRRYNEVLSYFLQASKTKDEHVLRSLFVDRVDAHTGEGYSMITMARRWPTIITDFIRMKSDHLDREIIKKELDVTDAEATVLLTKNQLYREWKQFFLPTIKDRVARLEVLAESRKKSIDEYREWLKPYVARFKMIKEKSQLRPAGDFSNPFMTPGFGQSQALTGVRLWMWRPFSVPQKFHAEVMREETKKGGSIVKKRRGFMVDPYDSIVKDWVPKIEERYGVTITPEEIDSVLKKAQAIPFAGAPPALDPKYLYYVFLDAKIFLSLIRTPPPEGLESDNLMFLPLRTWVMSHNIVLLHLIEIYAREKAFEKSINTLIGSKEAEEEWMERIEKEFNPTQAEVQRFASLKSGLSRTKKVTKPPLEKFFYLFFKRGPYEPVFAERVTKMYLRGSGAYFGQVTDYLMQKMGVE